MSRSRAQRHFSAVAAMIDQHDDRHHPQLPAAVGSLHNEPYSGLTLPRGEFQSEVLHGDCFTVLPTIAAGSVDCLFIDPPYNIGVDYGSGSRADCLTPQEYLYQMEELARHAVERLTPTGSLWFLCPERWADDIGIMLSGLLPHRNRIIWRETFGQYRDTSFPSGHRHLFYHVMDDKHSPFFSEGIRVPSQRMLDGDKRAAGPRLPGQCVGDPTIGRQCNRAVGGASLSVARSAVRAHRVLFNPSRRYGP